MRTLEQVRAFFQKNDNQSNLPSNYYRFFEMKDGEQASIRFLPDKNPDNPYAFLIEKTTHTLVINGETKSVPCLSMYGEKCPICDIASGFYKDDDKVNGKKYYKKRSHIAQVLVVEDPLPPDATTGMNSEGQIRYISLSYQLYQAVKAEFETAELDKEPWAYLGGTNFIIRKTKQGEYSTYVNSRFTRKPSDLDPDTIARVEDQLIDLSTLRPPHPGREKVEQMLEAAMTGAHYDLQKELAAQRAVTDAPQEEATPPWSQDEEESTAPQASPVKTVSKTPAVSEDEDIDAETAELLAQIRNRHRAKPAKD